MATRRFIRTAVWAWFVVSVVSSSASAQAPNGHIPPGDGAVAILAIDGSGDTRKELLARVEESVHAALQEAGLASVRNERVREAVRAAPDLADCRSPACLETLGAKVEAARFVVLSLDAQGLAYTLDLALYAVGREGPVKTVVLPCDACSLLDLDKAVRQGVAELLEPPAPMEVEITSEPSGAAVVVDGQEVGTAPYRGKLLPGPHQVRAEFPEHQPAEISIEVKEAAEGVQRFHIALVQAPKERTSRPFRSLRWGGAVATVGALAMGLTWIVVDGDGTCSDRPTCPEVYNTRTPGVIALGAGTALGAFTAWMFMRDRKDADRAANLAIVPVDGGAFARVGWSF